MVLAFQNSLKNLLWNTYRLSAINILNWYDKLLKNEKSWRRARIGAVILAVVWLLILYTVFKSFQIQEENEKILFFAIGWFLFWIVVVDWLNLRISHIESIKYYRSKEKTI
jgi:hypothetical protein